MPIEYEHRYLVEKFPNKEKVLPLIITQSYIGVDPERSLVQRIRSVVDFRGTRFLATHKIGKDPKVREVEYEIPRSAYNEFYKYFKIGSDISKYRYVVTIDGLKWDIDMFSNGMIIAELENPPENYSIEMFGKCVNITDKKEFKNFQIALNGYPIYTHLLADSKRS